MNAELDMLGPRRSILAPAAIAVATTFAMLAGGLWIGLALYRRAAPRVGDPFWAFAGAVAVPLLLIGGAWLTREGWRRRRDRGALQRLTRGDAPKEGAWVAVAGIAQSIGEPFEAPLSLRPALACHYRVMDRPYHDRPGAGRRPATAQKLALEGYHLVPTVIETSRGRVRVLAFPELRNLEKSHLESGTSHVEETAVRGPIWPARLVARARLFSQVTDRIRIDWRYGRVEEPGRTQRLEWVLAPGAAVCALGVWSAKGALLPHWARGSGIPVYAGSPSAATEILGTEARVYLSLGGILLVAAAAAGAWVAL